MKIILACMVITAGFNQTLFAQIKVACVGNSITEGFGLQDPSTQAYPAVLQTLLGTAYQVQNDGVSGKTLLKNGDQSYWTLGDLPQVFAFKPAIITIILGTNDTKPQNWDVYNSQFQGDYLAMIDTLNTISTKPKIFLVLPPPIWTNTIGASDTALQKIIIIIKQVALERGLPIIDCNTPFNQFQAYFSDGVHPNATGADSIAHIMDRSITNPQINFACIGNSITFGYGLQNASTQAYPAVLQTLLGSAYQVQNDGVNGKDMLKNGNQPYWTQGDLPQVFAFKPNIVTIELGTNDTYPPNWDAYNSEFKGDYLAMIDTLSTISTKPKIFPILPPPIFSNNTMNLYDSSLQKIVGIIKQIGLERGLTVIDCNTPFAQFQAHFPDGVHPDSIGADSIAHIIYRSITQPAEGISSENRLAKSPLIGKRVVLCMDGDLAAIYSGMNPGYSYEARVYNTQGIFYSKFILDRGGIPREALKHLPAGIKLVEIQQIH